MKFFHDSKAFTHPRIDKTKAIISNYYFWPMITDTIKNWISGCYRCNTEKSAYDHKSTDRVERMIRVIREKIRTNFNQSVNDWDSLLPFFLMSIRNSPTCKNGVSPAEILYGKNLKLMLHDLNYPASKHKRQHNLNIQKCKTLL
ncbi:hypothetical protein A3Q56_07076 [Intoshia linei]|uniref:Integrase zinc-binding domain-containing protein n=1 Tax=Intoshia linei TaxID=1819745 RepID=A0A177AT59_9BILA|nr:hypothetical protein A3Q56_07076 [Intoshia linei]